jgi:hypothetical protein
LLKKIQQGLKQASNGSHIVRIPPIRLHASNIQTLLIQVVGRLQNDGAGMFTRESLHSSKHGARKPKAFMLELCFFTRLLFLSGPLAVTMQQKMILTTDGKGS